MILFSDYYRRLTLHIIAVEKHGGGGALQKIEERACRENSFFTNFEPSLLLTDHATEKNSNVWVIHPHRSFFSSQL